jgi:hypothetical protein
MAMVGFQRWPISSYIMNTSACGFATHAVFRKKLHGPPRLGYMGHPGHPGLAAWGTRGIVVGVGEGIIVLDADMEEYLVYPYKSA